MTFLPSSLDPVIFAQARVSEVQLLKRQIEDSRYRGSRRVFQTLPRHMRRRAASYNIRRLPVRLRHKALEEANKDPNTAPKKIKKPPCRRRRRRPTDIHKEFDKRQKNKLWLETHLWHSKRAKMEDLWGYRIALKSNEKCLRSCLKASVTGCFIYDRSYYEIIELEIIAMDRLRPFLCENDIASITSGCPMIQSALYKPNSREILGPAIIITEPKMIRLFIHPLLSSFIFDDKNLFPFDSSSTAAATVMPQRLRGEFCIFDLKGSQALTITKQVLKIKSIDCKDYFTGVARDPRFGTGEMSNSPSLWDRSAANELVKNRATDHALNERRRQLVIPGGELCASSLDPSMPFALCKLNSSGSDHFLLIIPAVWGRILWRLLIMQKVRFGGLMEHKFVMAEHKEPYFPDDFAMSPAARPFIISKGAALEEKWNRTPPAKKINYCKLGVSCPFTPNFDIWTDRSPNLYICRIECDGKGSPTFNARIFSDDIEIGFVTTGYYSQRCGLGVAYAICQISENTSKTQHVYVQNQSGGSKRLAKITNIFFETNDRHL